MAITLETLLHLYRPGLPRPDLWENPCGPVGPQEVHLNRNTIFALAGGLAAGLLAGYFFFGGESSHAGPVVAAPANAAPLMPAPSLGGGLPGAMPGAMPAAALPSAEVQARIMRIEAVVLADPKNHGAWVALGNDYFDSHQPQKAVVAYEKALALKPEDPNVITDQGVMFRDLGQFDKALANFQKANKIQPSHLPSLMNIGVVYSSNLNKPDEAAKAWNRIITIAPASEQAAQARQMLGQLKK